MKDDDRLEKLMDEMLQGVPMEQPSQDFTQSVMEKIKKEKSAFLLYRPIMPKWGIMAVVVTLVILACWGVFGSETVFLGEPEYAQLLSNMDSWLLKNLPEFQFSNKIVYTLLPIALMILLQTAALKRHFDRRVAST